MGIERESKYVGSSTYVCSHSAYVFEIVVYLFQMQMHFPTQGTKLNWLSHEFGSSQHVEAVAKLFTLCRNFFSVVIAILHTSLAFIFIYCSYKFVM
jgi:hypothetical protein